jgi:hypothetical protein
MIPTRFEITPRAGMSSSWYLDNNPKEIRFVGIRVDGTEAEVFRKELSDWGDGSRRAWDVVASEGFVGVRIEVLRTKGYDADGVMHTSIGQWRVYGHPDPMAREL